MTTATITLDNLIRQHADNLAYVAENPTPATTLDEFLRHLTYAAENFDLAGINGHEDLETAGTLLLRAAVLLKEVRDMTDEYRTMVGD